MRKIKEVLRLRWANGLSKRKIAQSCGISRPAVDEYLRRAEEAGLSWPLPPDLDDGALERRLFPAAPALPSKQRRLPEWTEVHRELKGKGVTLLSLTALLEPPMIALMEPLSHAVLGLRTE